MALPVQSSNIERYWRSLSRCEIEARTACSSEVEALWLTIAGSYRFLLERENRLAAEDQVAH